MHVFMYFLHLVLMHFSTQNDVMLNGPVLELVPV